jgi:hypothetical protein
VRESFRKMEKQSCEFESDEELKIGRGEYKKRRPMDS